MFHIFCNLLKIIHNTYNFPGLPQWLRGNGVAGDSGSIPGLGKSPGGGLGNPSQYSCLENPLDREAWQSIICRVTESDKTEVI